MTKHLCFIAALASAVLCSKSASAADLCRAVALRDVAAIEDPQSILRRGEYDTAVTQYRVNRHTGVASFCSHGGYCYPTHVVVAGKQVEALRLTNCKIGKRDDSEDKDEIFYSVDVVRAKNTPEALRIDDIDNRLLELGLCSACASNVAEFYVKKPGSDCARLAKQALEGSPTALQTLQTLPDYCRWGW